MSRRQELEKRYEELVLLKRRLLETRDRAHPVMLARTLQQLSADLQSLREAYARLDQGAGSESSAANPNW